MKVVKPIKNLVKYGSIGIMHQVDMDIMRPIFESKLKELTFYSPEDHFLLEKKKKHSLRFQYSSSKENLVWVHGTIYAREPRLNFEDIDVLSFMEIDPFNSDKSGELFNFVKNIAECTGIEKIVPGSTVISDDAARLYNIHGNRRFNDLVKYQKPKPKSAY